MDALKHAQAADRQENRHEHDHLGAYNGEHGDADVLAMLDARMGELYLGRYRDGGDGLMTPDGAERAIAPARAGIGGLPVGAVLAGSGAEALGDVDPGERLLRASGVSGDAERVARAKYGKRLSARARGRAHGADHSTR